MAIRDILLVFVIGCLSVSRNGFGESRLSSMEEDLELETELKLLNKPGVKTIKTKFGETYTCVEFYKQPAFDHPALRNVTFNPYHVQESAKTSEMRQLIGNMWENGKGCPVGTVPIRKMSKENLIQAKLASQILSDSEMQPLNKANPGYHYAVNRVNIPSRKWHGAKMFTSVYNVPAVSGTQFSRAQMELRNGVERITTGWMVNPSLYNDNRPRGFAITSAGGGKACFNVACPGLILTSPGLPVDMAFQLPTERGSPDPRDEKFTIVQDAATKDWILRYQVFELAVGYWPAQIFSRLNDHATYVEWGGAVYSPPDVPSPPMGSGGGDNPKDGHQLDAYCKNLQIVDETHKLTKAEGTQKFEDIGSVYKVQDTGNFGSASDMFYFGGFGSYKGV